MPKFIYFSHPSASYPPATCKITPTPELAHCSRISRVGPVSRCPPCFFFLGLDACEERAWLPPFRWSPFSSCQNHRPAILGAPTRRVESAPSCSRGSPLRRVHGHYRPPPIPQPSSISWLPTALREEAAAAHADC